MRAYSIGQVARLLGVKPHIIRYWEGELPLLAPRKGLTGRREYTARDVQLLMRFRHLLHERKFTVEGAKRTLWEELGGAAPDGRARIAEIRGDLVELLVTLQGRKGGEMTEGELRERFTALGHGHLFDHWAERPARMRRRLLEDLESLDTGTLAGLARRLTQADRPDREISPVSYVSLAESASDGEARSIGEGLIADGRTALLTVAGGQGSRLGVEGPKGLFPVTPVRGATLFEVAAEKIQAARVRYGVSLPWLIMTSPQNHRETREYFETERHFGLPRDNVHFFTQGVLPSLDPGGLLLMAHDGGLLFNPNGHGGVVEGMRSAGLLARLKERGIEELFYFQVDNPLVTAPDPTFLGFHRRAGSLISSKVVAKAFPDEKLGVIGKAGGTPAVIEYSDAGPEIMHATDPDGKLLYGQGSIAIHLLNVDFLVREELSLPLHIARKRVNALIPTASGTEIEDREAVKFEMFVFDLIPFAERSLFYEVDRREEFAPLKNREGVDSIETCIRGQTEKFAAWLEACGVEVPRDSDGKSRNAVEISPLFADDRRALAAKRASLKSRIDEDTLLA